MNKINRAQATWLTRLAPALVASMLVCVVSIFQGYWWQDTFQAIWQCLIVVSAIHIILQSYMRSWLLYILDCIVISVSILAITAHRFVSLGDDVTFLHEISQYLAKISSLIIIVVLLVLIQLILAKAVRTKKQLTYLFGVCLLIVCIKDSFSPLRLWWAVALLIVIYLVWHALLHFSKLQMSDKDHVNLFLHKPIAILAPLLAIISIILLISTNLPSRPPLLEDPYALWMQSKGIKVQIDSGENYPSRATPAENGALNRQTSGYSRSDSPLGGGFEFDYTPIMTVKTSHKSYWRGESRSYYDGIGWSNLGLTDREKRERDNSVVAIGEPVSGIDRPLATTIDVEQQYTFLTKMPVPVLFAAAQMTQISSVSYLSEQAAAAAEVTGFINSSDLTELTAGSIFEEASWTAGSWALQLDGAGVIDANIAAYSITSEVVVIDPEQLSKSRAASADSEVYYSNTYLPQTLPERVKDLALEITKDAVNDYEAVLLLEKHLKENYRYTNQPDLTMLSGNSEDFVDQFLFELQEGYCDYFSTAMVIMARSLDYPARWVKGFSSGVSDFEQEMSLGQNPNMMLLQSDDTSGTYTVRNADAHSWVEIYFEGFGWISFEPTPGFAFPYTYTENAENPLLPLTPELPAVAEANATPAEKGMLQLPTWLAWTITVVIVAIIAFYMVKFRVTIMKLFRKFIYRGYSPNERIAVELKGFLAFCHRIGLERNGNLTMRETIEAWDFGSTRWRDEVQQLLGLYERAHYSKEQLTPEHLQQVQNLIVSLKKNWNS